MFSRLEVYCWIYCGHSRKKCSTVSYSTICTYGDWILWVIHKVSMDQTRMRSSKSKLLVCHSFWYDEYHIPTLDFVCFILSLSCSVFQYILPFIDYDGFLVGIIHILSIHPSPTPTLTNQVECQTKINLCCIKFWLYLITQIWQSSCRCRLKVGINLLQSLLSPWPIWSIYTFTTKIYE